MNDIKESIIQCLNGNNIEYNHTPEEKRFDFMIKHNSSEMEIQLHYNDELRIIVVVAFPNRRLLAAPDPSFFQLLNALNNRYTFSVLTYDSEHNLLSSRVALAAPETNTSVEMVNCALSCAIDGIASSLSDLEVYFQQE